MNEDKFWALIAASKSQASEPEEQAEAVVELLQKESPENIITFDELFETQLIEAYTWEVWGAAYIVNGGCSDDGFEYFRCWLIGQGKEIFEKVVANPDSIAEFVEAANYENEDLLYAASDAYEALTGKELPPRKIKYPAEPSGYDWQEDELPKLFPNTAKKFDLN